MTQSEGCRFPGKLQTYMAKIDTLDGIKLLLQILQVNYSL